VVTGCDAGCLQLVRECVSGAPILRSPRKSLRHFSSIESGSKCNIRKFEWAAAAMLPLLTEAAVAVLISADCAQEVDFAESRP
jgi:hypothetical protein